MLIGLGQPRPAMAVGNLQLGPVELHPSFEISQSFDDNICRTEAKVCIDPQDSTKTKDGTDQITIFSPGLQVALPFQDHRLRMEYRGDFGRYKEFKPENYSDNMVKGDLGFNFTGGFSALLKDDWKAGHDPRGYSQNVEMDFYHLNTAGAELGFRAGSKLRLVLNGSNMVLNYQEDSRNGFRDRMDNTLGGTVYYRVMPKTSMLVEYNSTAVSFEEDDPDFGLRMDSQVGRGYLGLTWDLTTRSQGTFKYGYIQKDFKDPALADYKGGIFSLILNHDLSTRNSVHLDAGRDVNESNDPGQPYYISAGGHLEFTHFIQAKLSTRFQAGFFRDQYPNATTVGTQTEKRMDSTWTAGAKLDYHVQEWLNLGLKFDHSQRRSNFDTFGYIDNLVAISIGMVL